MKHYALKKVLSLLLVICMMASFAGCVPGEEDPTEPSTVETSGPAENTTVPTDGTTAPTDSTDATTPTEEPQASTTPTEDVADPPATEAPSTDITITKEWYEDAWCYIAHLKFTDYSQCARLLAEKGCFFGVPLDGGGSSTMVFQGKILNSAKAGQRSVVDFVYFK